MLRASQPIASLHSQHFVVRTFSQAKNPNDGLVPLFFRDSLLCLKSWNLAHVPFSATLSAPCLACQVSSLRLREIPCERRK
jgi:hypothetical protein